MVGYSGMPAQHRRFAYPRQGRATTSHGKLFEQKASLAKQEWSRQKYLEGARNDAIDELMKLVGLEEVKSQMLLIKDKVDVCKFQNANLERERFNAVFLGNPGTGTTPGS
jgi:hypothetical protein